MTELEKRRDKLQAEISRWSTTRDTNQELIDNNEATPRVVATTAAVQETCDVIAVSDSEIAYLDDFITLLDCELRAAHNERAKTVNRIIAEHKELALRKKDNRDACAVLKSKVNTYRKRRNEANNKISSLQTRLDRVNQQIKDKSS